MENVTSVLDDTLRVKIKSLVCEALRAEPGTVTLTSHFVDDHAADSLQFIDVLTSIERECGVLIDPQEMSRMTTLGGIYAVVAEAR